MTSFDKTTGFFTAFREDYGFAYFSKPATPNPFRDVGLWGVGVSYIIAVLTLTVVLAFLGTRGYSRWRVTLQLVITLAIGFSIIVAGTGNAWQRASHTTPGDLDETVYTIKVGLRETNISLERRNKSDGHVLEYHNVKIGWIEIDQAEREFREALIQGWPLGLLRMAHYMSLDVGGMRYMRAFRWSGYSVYIMLWCAFACWLIANVIVSSKISYAAILLLITGFLQLLGCIIYDTYQPADFFIPLDDIKKSVLRLSYDWMFWLTAFTGIFAILLSIILLVLDYFRPADMNKFFGTQAEIQSAYGNELEINKNKDIKGLIRNISVKTPGLRKRVTIDEERNGKAELQAKDSILAASKSNGSADKVYERREVFELQLRKKPKAIREEVERLSSGSELSASVTSSKSTSPPPAEPAEPAERVEISSHSSSATNNGGVSGTKPATNGLSSMGYENPVFGSSEDIKSTHASVPDINIELIEVTADVESRNSGASSELSSGEEESPVDVSERKRSHTPPDRLSLHSNSSASTASIKEDNRSIAELVNDDHH